MNDFMNVGIQTFVYYYMKAAAFRMHARLQVIIYELREKLPYCTTNSVLITQK